ncbi:MAG: SDR family oxidoreductase, partial [Anaerolineae bacterium]|nr:SDR family oxidoreductase [Anaerolineae bacterium]
MIDLAGKHALIAGGLGHVTQGVAQTMAQAGAVITTARDTGDPAQGWPDAHALSFDDPVMLREQLRALDPFDVVIISPAAIFYKLFLDTTDADWDRAISDNFERAVWTAQAAAHTLIERQRPGSIIFLSSVAAQMPFAHMSALGASLGALRALAKMAAVDLAPHDITVNVIECGWTEHEANQPYLSPEGRTHVEAGTPTGRIVTAEEIGHACCFLASDLARSITGAILTIDGGYTLTRSDGASALSGVDIPGG